jgi:hypothetical protein
VAAVNRQYSVFALKQKQQQERCLAPLFLFAQTAEIVYKLQADLATVGDR